jgi:hypothetical protein
MKYLALVLALAGVLAGCGTPSATVAPSPGVLRGRIDGAASLPKDAFVQIYRLDSEGRPQPDPFAKVPVDKVGRFSTRALSPGRYRLVYRTTEGPPSFTSVRVPNSELVVMRPVTAAGLVQVVAKAAPGRGKLVCRLTESKPREGVPDVREFEVSPDEPFFLRGLEPGRWMLDLPEIGATTEVDVPAGAAQRELVVDPPASDVGATVTGEIRRIDGSGGAWLVVAARPLNPDGETANRWGRYSTTDLSGRYRIVGIPPGQALIRVECREMPIRILAVPHVVTIPPSGTVEMGFVVVP